VIAFDTNILVYAHRPDLAAHERAFDVVAAALGGTAQVGLCWPVIQEFLAVVTNAKIFAEPTPAERAFGQVEHWLSSPRAMTLHESPTHLRTLRSLVVDGRATGGALHDARIAALCLDHGVSELLTADRDFSRFPALRVRNPLIDSR
jgi:hypothetical protein